MLHRNSNPFTDLKKSVRQKLIISGSAMAMAFVAAAPANAQFVPPECSPNLVSAGDTVTCSGNIGSQIATSFDNVTINLTGATVDTADLWGVRMDGNNIAVNVDANSSITSRLDGVFMFSFGSGDIDVTAAGSITGNNRAGVVGIHSGTTGDINISTTNTFGGVSSAYSIGGGIYALNYADDTNITSSGVSGGHNFGIFSRNSNQGSTTISANEAYSTSGDGIYVGHNFGTEDISVTVTGSAVGAINGVEIFQGGFGITTLDIANASGGNVGIDVTSFGSDINLTSGGKISGDQTGIDIAHFGSGAINIDVASVTGSAEDGIEVDNNGGTDTNIIAETVSGNSRGIDVGHYGSGDVNITAGDVSATYSDGIYVYTGQGSGAVNITTSGTVDGNGDEGIEVIHNGTGTLNITANDVIGTDNGGYGDGILAINNFGDSVSVNVTGTATSGDDGITVINYNGSNTVTVNNVNATGATNNSSGVNVINSSPYGRYGVEATDILMTSTGTITADFFGVLARNNGTGSTSLNVVDVSATDLDGISAFNGSTATDMIINATGDISGGRFGILSTVVGAGATTINANNVTGTLNDGILARGYGPALDISVTTTGTVSGGQNGIAVRNNGYGSATVSANDVTGNNYTGIYVLNSLNTTDASVTATGTVTGATNGIEIINAGSGTTTVTANNVTGTSNTGVRVYTGNYAGNISVTTSGTVTGGIDGIDVTSSNSSDIAINVAGGSVTGGENGINIDNTAGGTTTVTVNGTVTGGTGAGIIVDSSYGNAVNITAGAGANISASSGLAIVDGNGDANVMIGDGAVVSGEIRLGNGSDVLTITSGADVMGVTVMDGGDDDATDDGFVDTLNILGATVNLDASNIINWENFNIVDANVILSNLVTDGVDICGGSTTLTGASAVNYLDGCVNDDGITVDGSTVVSGRIEGAGGADTISVLGDASVLGSILGGGAGSDDSQDDDSGDIITIDTTGSVLSINAGAGDDSVLLMSGTIMENVATGFGNDNVLLDGATVGTHINTGPDDDMIRLISGSAGNILSGVGEDTIYLAGATVGAINSGDDDDILMLTGGTASSVQSGEGDDSVVLDGAVISGALATGLGDDTVVLTSGSAHTVRTDDGMDTLTLNGATIATSIETGADADTVTLTSGSANSVDSGDGDDTVLLNGATITTTINSGDGNDTVGLDAGTAASVMTGAGMDTVSLNGAMISGLIDTGADDDTVALAAGSAAGVLTGEGDDTLSLSGADIGGDIDTGTGDDTVDLTGGTASNVLTGDGEDTLTLNGAAIAGNIDTGADADTITLTSGSAANVWAGTGNDVLNFNGAAISGNVDMGDDDDTVNYWSGTYSALLGGAGTDTLNFNGAGQTLGSTGTAGDPISQFENYNFNNSGWVLTGLHTGLQEVNFNAGANSLVGRIESVTTTIGAGALLDAQDGSSVGGTLVNSGALTIAGGGTGTFTVDGDYTQTGNSTFDVVSLTEHDQLVVNGTANLGGSLTVNQSSPFFLGTITLVDADALNGTFASDNINGGGLLLSNSLEYDLANADVNLVGTRTDASAIAGLTDNQVAVGNALINDYLAGITTGGLTGTALGVGFVGDAAVLGQTLEELHPEEVIAGMQTFQNSQALFTNALTKANDCARGLGDGSVGNCDKKKVWAAIQYVGHEQDGTFTDVDYETDGVEVAGGISNYGAGPLRLGAAIGYSSLNSEIDGLGLDEVKTEFYKIAGIATLDVGSETGFLGHIDAVASYAGGKNNIDRIVVGQGIVSNETQDADPSVKGMSGLLRFTMEGAGGKYLPIQPFVQVGVDNVKQDAFDIGSVVGLSVDEIDTTRTTFGAGGTVQTTLGGNSYVKLTGTGLFHTGDTDSAMSSRFTNSTSGSRFATVGEDIEQQFIVDFGIGTQTNEGLMFGAEGFAEFGDLEGYGGRVKVGHKF